MRASRGAKQNLLWWPKKRTVPFYCHVILLKNKMIFSCIKTVTAGKHPVPSIYWKKNMFSVCQVKDQDFFLSRSHCQHLQEQYVNHHLLYQICNYQSLSRFIWHLQKNKGGKKRWIITKNGTGQKKGTLSRVLWKCLRRKAIDQSVERPFVPEE